MLELLVLYLEFLDLAARLLGGLAFAATIFKAGFTKLFESFDPIKNLIVTYIVL
jgi:hypothetical protein